MSGDGFLVPYWFAALLAGAWFSSLIGMAVLFWGWLIDIRDTVNVTLGRLHAINREIDDLLGAGTNRRIS